MCGRYNLAPSPELATVFKALDAPYGEFKPMYNIAPTETVPVIHRFGGAVTSSMMRWWLVPSWSNGPSQDYSMFNARIEKLNSSRAFKGPFNKHPAVIPASSFIEWKTEDGNKQPYLIEGEQPLLLAGAWDCWESKSDAVYSCTMATQAAKGDMAQYHKRMPVLLSVDQARQWLSSGSLNTLNDLETGCPELRFTAIDPTIGNSRHKDAPVPAK